MFGTTAGPAADIFAEGSFKFLIQISHNKQHKHTTISIIRVDATKPNACVRAKRFNPIA